MGRSFNTLKAADVTSTPIKLKYQNTVPSSSLSSKNITISPAYNEEFDYHSPNPSQEFLLYRSVENLYYMNYISGSLMKSASGYEWYPQSTAASGSLDADNRYFPTESNAEVVVISIPRLSFGENVARNTFSMVATDNSYNLIDDGNGNIVDAVAGNVHVGNILYNQGIAILTNPDYTNALIPVPVCGKPIGLIVNETDTTADLLWTPNPGATYRYLVSTSSMTPANGAGTSIDAELGTVTVTGLSPSTTYYAFLQNDCRHGSYSMWISQSFTTNLGLVPLRTGLILELQSWTGSDYGITHPDSMDKWYDMSGNGNHFHTHTSAGSPYYSVYTASYFGAQPAVYFQGIDVTGSALQSNTNLVGLSGSTGTTIFVVTKPIDNLSAAQMMIEYAKSGSDYITCTGSLSMVTYKSAPFFKTLTSTKGNVGQSDALSNVTFISSSVMMATIDYTLSTNEVTSYANNVSGSQTRTNNVNNSGSFDSYILSIGASTQDYRWNVYDGYIGAVIMYDRVLSSTEQTTVYNYLKSTYNLP